MPIYKMSQKKNGLQKYRVRINFTDKNGKAYQWDRVAYGLVEAKDLERKLTVEAKGIAEGAQKITVSQLCEEYLATKKPEVKPSTYYITKRNIASFIIPLIGNEFLDKLSKKKLKEWKEKINERNLATSTKKNKYILLSSILNFAVKMDYMIKNPLKDIGNFKDPYFTSFQDKIRYYTPEQFKLYINAALQSAKTIMDWNCYVFFNIAFYTGMRFGEINALKWSDIEGNIIHVRKSIIMSIEKKRYETVPKTRSSIRDIQIPTSLIYILNNQKKRQETQPGFCEDFRVCGGEKYLYPQTIYTYNEKYAKMSGLPKIKIHDFRHSHASILANNGINIQEIARRLGHSDIKTTWNIYSHLYPREMDRALEILNKIT